MSDELAGYAGSVARPRPLLELAGEQPYRWQVHVTELELAGYGKRFEVRATRWGGPKLEGTPDPVGVTIAQVDDVIAERDGQAARQIALRAAELLAKGVAVSLQQLQRDVAGERRAGDL